MKERGRRQVLTGTVVSDKQDKTVTVAVQTTVLHPLYHRFMKRTSKYAAHDEANECREGDRVVIVQSRPLSKRKRWRVRDIVERAR
ncbi:MAG: 30S ribosomal protein S17 [Thermoanaerobaculia bacterium]|nr:30S ribosomal protein S17 [Thermoanaerobaculia bacterium]